MNRKDKMQQKKRCKKGNHDDTEPISYLHRCSYYKCLFFFKRTKIFCRKKRHYVWRLNKIKSCIATEFFNTLRTSKFVTRIQRNDFVRLVSRQTGKNIIT